MTDKERAELYAKTLYAIVDVYRSTQHEAEVRLTEIYNIAIAALAEGA